MISFITIGAMFVSDAFGHNAHRVVGIKLGEVERRRADGHEAMTISLDDGTEMVIDLTDTTDPKLYSSCAKYYQSGDVDVVVTGCEGQDRSISIGGQGSWSYHASENTITKVTDVQEGCGGSEPPEEEFEFKMMKAAREDIEAAGDAFVSRNVNAQFLTEVQYYYDASLLARFNGDHDRAKAAVREMHEHSAVHMRHQSIGRRIHLETRVEPTFTSLSLHADGRSSLDIFMVWLRRHRKCENTVAFHHLITDRRDDTNVGIAFIGTVCAGQCFNSGITELWSSIASAAQTLSHEFGHNLGMQHTFHPSNEGRECHGLMSYGERPNTWSECSRDSWQLEYDTFVRTRGQFAADKCFKALPNTLNPPTVDPTPHPTPNPTVEPTTNPTVNPTGNPTGRPTANPLSPPATVPTPSSGGCTCSGVINAYGFGGPNCAVEWCYTAKGACPDGRSSGVQEEQEWSYAACQGGASVVPTPPQPVPTPAPAPTPRPTPEPSTGCDESFSGRGADYRGCQTRTRSGRTCMKWTDQSPHRHSRTDANFPNKGLGDHNYCRNPDGDLTLWCYTTDPNSRFEYCDPL